MDLKKFEFKKSFGQNFINDDEIINHIIDVSNILNNSLIIEVGPGAGSLTGKLLQTGNNVISYEIDNRLESILKKEFASFDNFHLVMGDFLKCSPMDDINKFKYDHLYLIANLPYYITTPIITKVINELDVDKMVIMVQKEVADRLSASCCSSDYGSFTVFLNYYFDVVCEFIVPREKFTPSPNVDSAIVSLSRKKNKVFVSNEELFFKLVRDSFMFKRKNLKNNLKGYDLEKISLVLNEFGHDLSCRAEQLSLEEFAAISNCLSK